MPLPDLDLVEILIWKKQPANNFPTDRTALQREARESEGVKNKMWVRQKMKGKVNIKKEMYNNVIDHKQTDRKEILRKQRKCKVKVGVQYCAPPKHWIWWLIPEFYFCPFFTLKQSRSMTFAPVLLHTQCLKFPSVLVYHKFHRAVYIIQRNILCDSAEKKWMELLYVQLNDWMLLIFFSFLSFFFCGKLAENKLVINFTAITAVLHHVCFNCLKRTPWPNCFLAGNILDCTATMLNGEVVKGQ